MAAIGASDIVFRIVLWFFLTLISNVIWRDLMGSQSLKNLLWLNTLETQKMMLLFSCYLQFLLFLGLLTKNWLIYLTNINCVLKNCIHNNVEYVYIQNRHIYDLMWKIKELYSYYRDKITVDIYKVIIDIIYN